MQAKMRRHRDFNADCQGDAVPPDRIRDYRLLLEHGRVVWSSIVQASGDLFEPGSGDGTAYAVYGMTSYFTAHPEALRYVAGRLFALKEIEFSQDEDRAALAASLSGEHGIPKPVPVPLSVSAGHTGAFLSTLIIHRGRLPTRRLTLPGLPVVVCPERTPGMMLLPTRYWSPNLVRLWHEEEIAAVGKTSGGVRVTGLMVAPDPEEVLDVTEAESAVE